MRWKVDTIHATGREKFRHVLDTFRKRSKSEPKKKREIFRELSLRPARGSSKKISELGAGSRRSTRRKFLVIPCELFGKNSIDDHQLSERGAKPIIKNTGEPIIKSTENQSSKPRSFAIFPPIKHQKTNDPRRRSTPTGQTCKSGTRTRPEKDRAI